MPEISILTQKNLEVAVEEKVETIETGQEIIEIDQVELSLVDFILM